MDCSNKTWDPINGDRQNAILPCRSFRIVIHPLSYELYALNFEQKLDLFIISKLVYYYTKQQLADKEITNYPIKICNDISTGNQNIPEKDS